jgi:predicted O-linked N-acetylglucosamine transferase (SPINDLY family)
LPSPLFDQALVLFRGGQLVDAERIARRLLAKEPKHARALHLLGIISSQKGNQTEALRLINAALQIEGESATIYNSRGNVLAALKRFDEALASFQTAIELDPASATAFGNQGNVYQELARFDEAVASYDKAIALDPDDAEAFYNRGGALQELKRFDEAVPSYDEAIALRHDYAEAFSNRGTTLQALGRHSEAVTSYDRAIALKPNFPEALCSRGSAFQELERFDEAIASYSAAIALKTDFAEAFNYRGMSFERLGRLPDALASFETAISLKPDYADAYGNQGNVLKQLKRLDEALAGYDAAIALKPDFAEAFNDRGIVLGEMKSLDEALASFESAINLKPDFADAFYNRGLVLGELQYFDQALASFDRAVALKPDYSEAFNSRGNILSKLKRFDEALASYDQAIALKPDNAEAFHNRGTTLRELRRFDEALASYDRALAINPEHRYAVGGLLDCALRICDWTRTAELVAEIKAHILERKSIVDPFNLLAISSDAALHLKCADLFVKDKISMPPRSFHNEATWHHEKIRIAYLSADFHGHATAYLMADLFELHDRSRFEVVGISFGPDDKSNIRRRIVKAFDQFHDALSKNDEDVARLVHDLQVDIAIDLKGFTKDCRPAILAPRPAPIQVNYLGYPGTMGAEFIDYVIADAIALPFDQQPYYVERIVHLPECYQVNDSRKKIADHTPTRQQIGLPERGLVFCCFNNSYKITAPIFDVWMRLLRTIEGSALWLLRDNDGAENNLRGEAAARGIDPARLVFANRISAEDHLARHHLADLFLDTLPCNAHTTASDALWAGLPVLTCCGESFAGRVAASLLTAVGLPELVTQNLDDYEALALRLARNASSLASIKAKLARNRESYPLFNSKRFTRHLEAAYTTMWEIWQRGEGPRSFSVAPEPTGQSWGAAEDAR